MFGPRFITPIGDSTSGADDSSANKTKSTPDDDTPIKLSEIMVPIDQYWGNLQELL